MILNFCKSIGHLLDFRYNSKWILYKRV